jgi:hypothetical protein
MPSLLRHPLRPFVTLLAIGAGSALVACGGGDDSGNAEANFDDAQLEFAQCMRENGIDMPDPDSGGGGGGIRIQLPEGVDPDSETFQSAQEECQPIIEDAIPEGERPDPSEMRDQAVKLAQCMREHGVNMPDPQVDAEGRVTMGGPPPGGGEGGSGPDEGIQSDPDFEEAQEACQEEVGGFGPGPGGGPDGGPSTDESDSGS